MAQLGFGGRREQQESQRHLATFGIHSVADVIQRLRRKKPLQAEVLTHIVGAYGNHDEVRALLDAKNETPATPRES